MSQLIRLLAVKSRKRRRWRREMYSKVDLVLYFKPNDNQEKFRNSIQHKFKDKVPYSNVKINISNAVPLFFFKLPIIGKSLKQQ